MVDASLKAVTQGKMLRFKHVLKQDVHHTKTNKSKLVRTKFLFLPKEHRTRMNGHIMPFADQLMIRLSAQYHPNISSLEIRMRKVNQDEIQYDTTRIYEFSSMKALRAFVKKTVKKIQSYKRQPTLTIWARHGLFQSAKKASSTKKRG